LCLLHSAILDDADNEGIRFGLCLAEVRAGELEDEIRRGFVVIMDDDLLVADFCACAEHGDDRCGSRETRGVKSRFSSYGQNHARIAWPRSPQKMNHRPAA
jgi:hypothetical protein